MSKKFHLYIASCVPDGGIYHYLWENGDARFLDKTDGDRPMYLAICGDYLYGVLRQPFGNSQNSGVCRWKIGADGTLGEQSEILSTDGVVGCHLTVFQERIYVANYLSGSVIALPEGIVQQHVGKGPNPLRQEAAHTHFVGMTPEGKYLLAVDLGTDSIYVYTPELKLVEQVSMPAGCGCRHLAWSEDGKYVFCVNELASTVSALGYANGKLSLLGTASALPEGWTGENTAAAIRAVGDKVYVSNRGADNVAVFTHKDGVLSKPVFADTEGVGPRDIFLHEDTLFCANEQSNCVSVFTCEAGKIQSKNLHLTIPKPLCIIAKPE